MPILITALIYLIFFLSGATALVYEVIWVRKLSLVFGGSHLAVTTVLAVVMGGLALGSWLFGRRVRTTRNLLRLYGALEIGIAFFALLFIALLNLYSLMPAYSFESLTEHSHQLSRVTTLALRVVLAAIALIVPTTLLGGTLPVLAAFMVRGRRAVGRGVAYLYALNTFGAVAGCFGAGFYLLGRFGVSDTMAGAITVNVLLGIACFALQGPAARHLAPGGEEAPAPLPAVTQAGERARIGLVVWGIGVSGFCALGYEVLWTRILGIVIGTNVYGFTLMLAAFLTGIAAGSGAYGLWARRLRPPEAGGCPVSRLIGGFGMVQIAIGVSALVVTVLIRDLPTRGLFLQDFFTAHGTDLFRARQFASFALVFSYLFIPAFFMGVAFPLAGTLDACRRRKVGHAVGEVLTCNTIGAILGTVASGFVLLQIFGIERSLYLLAAMNAGFGLLILASLLRGTARGLVTAGTVLAVLGGMAAAGTMPRVWDAKYFAIYRTNQPEVFRTPDLIAEAKRHTDVLYYAEGIQSIVSSIRIRGGYQAFLRNGRIESSDHSESLQNQYALGHLPMLLHRNPRKVLVIGAGSGIILGAVSVHPSVSEMTLAEVEPKVLGVTRSFAAYNHGVLDDRRLRVAFSDGRNYLATTGERYDVITADPIHPWLSGAGYNYTREYFELAAEHLRAGGIMCQWLPLYDLSADDLRSVVRTFRQAYRHVLVWMTQGDAMLIGSNAPILLSEDELAARIAAPAVAADLERVQMGSATDLLSFFVMGTAGADRFSRTGRINTDDNLYLEFSVPRSTGKASLPEVNVNALARHRESVLAYLDETVSPADRLARENRWMTLDRAASLALEARAIFLGGRYDSPRFGLLVSALERNYASFAPWRFLRNEYLEEMASSPQPLDQLALALLDESGRRVVVNVAAVMSRVSRELTVVDFVDSDERVIIGQADINGRGRDGSAKRLAAEVMEAVRVAYNEELTGAEARGKPLPDQAVFVRRMREIIATMTGRQHGNPYPAQGRPIKESA